MNAKRIGSSVRFAIALLLVIIQTFGAISPAYAATLTVTNTDDSGAGSLRQAIADASSGDTIVFDSALSGGTIYLASTLILDKGLTVDGSMLAVPININGDTNQDGFGNVRVFYVTPGATITLDSLKITKGAIALSSGGGIYNDGGTITLNRITVNENSASHGGGGIYNDGTLTVKNSVIANNQTEPRGGGIYNAISGTLIIVDSILSGNRSIYDGGGIYNSGALVVRNSALIDNFATWWGGGVFNEGNLTIDYSNFSGNSTFIAYGSGIHNTGMMTIKSSTFMNHSSHYSLSNTGTSVVTDSILSNGVGGVSNEGIFTLRNSIVSSNQGTGIYNAQSAILNITNTTLSENGNYDLDGGGLLNFGTVNMRDSTVSGNRARLGGGIVNGNGVMTIENSTVSSNHATLSGGGINSAGTLTLIYSTVVNNTTDTGDTGGGIDFGGTVNLRSSILGGNQSGASGLSNANADCRGSGTLTSQGYNLIGIGTGCWLSGDFSGNTYVFPSNVFTDMLEPLADNGGMTQTHALIPSPANPALNAIPVGTNDCGIAPFDFDQRGEPRPFGSACDIGAYEGGTSNTPPTVNPGGPYDGNEGSPIALSGATASDTDVSDTLTYNWSVNSASCSFDDASALNPNLTCSDVGNLTATLDVSDGVNPPVTSNAAVTVIYNWAGFFQPVDNLPTLNSVKAGQAIPIKFGLGGDQGLNIFAAGYPKSEQIACSSTAMVDGIEETVTAGSSSLTYDPGSDRYHYVWKTEKSWEGTCRQLVVKLLDGTFHRASFKFK